MMLTLKPKAWFSWDFSVLEGDREVTFLDRHWFREQASFTIDGVEYHVRRTSVLSGTFVLEADGRVLGRAEKTSVISREFALRIGAEPFRLGAKSAFRREFRLWRGGREVGSVRPQSIFGRGATADLPGDLSLHVRIFMVCLVLVLWKRSADSAAS